MGRERERECVCVSDEIEKVMGAQARILAEGGGGGVVEGTASPCPPPLAATKKREKEKKTEKDREKEKKKTLNKYCKVWVRVFVPRCPPSSGVPCVGNPTFQPGRATEFLFFNVPS